VAVISDVREAAPPGRAVGVDRRGTTKPVHVFAALGAAFLLVEAYVLLRWVTGPYFTTVPSGPSDPPTWMKIVQNAVRPGSAHLDPSGRLVTPPGLPVGAVPFDVRR